MADFNCSACEDIRQTAPDFVVNGLTDEACASLGNGTGLNPASDNDNCTDLHNINDCLIGNMENEVDSYDVCDWKEFMKMFIPNLWTTLKSLVCAVCGIWTHLRTLICTVNNLSNGFVLNIGEEETDDSYVVAGKGVSFLSTGGGTRESEVKMEYIAGGLVQVQGSLRFYSSSFTDEGACWNYDHGGANPQKSASRLGNSEWNNTTGVVNPCVGGGELLFEIRIKKSAYPYISQLFAGSAHPSGGGGYQVNLTFFNEGSEAFGQHGSSDTKHTVPAGWIYVQARMVNISYLHANGSRYSPRGFMGIRFNQDEIPC